MNHHSPLPPPERIPCPLPPTVDPVSDEARPPLAGTHRRVHMRALKLRLIPLRFALLTLCCALIGAALVRYTVSALSPALPSLLLGDHLPDADIAPPIFWLRLCLSGLVEFLLVAVAGLTYISGAVTTGVLGFRALAEGAVLGLLGLAAAGQLPSQMLPLATADPSRLLLAYALRAVLCGVLRIGLATRARRISIALTDKEYFLPQGKGGISPLLLGYIASVLLTGLLTAATEGAYTLLLYQYC